jgi:hypothetical protein
VSLSISDGYMSSFSQPRLIPLLISSIQNSDAFPLSSLDKLGRCSCAQSAKETNKAGRLCKATHLHFFSSRFHLRHSSSKVRLCATLFCCITSTTRPYPYYFSHSCWHEVRRDSAPTLHSRMELLCVLSSLTSHHPRPTLLTTIAHSRQHRLR